jgi:DNA-binding transcriptional LysR family regulator
MFLHAEQIEEAVTSFERNLATSDQTLTGTVRVTCPEALGYRLMRSKVLDKFNVRFPGLQVEFVMSDKNFSILAKERRTLQFALYHLARRLL